MPCVAERTAGQRTERTVARAYPKRARIGAAGAAQQAEQARWLRAMVAEVVERECGDAPRRANPNSTAWRAYVAGMDLLAQELAAWESVARTNERAPDLRAFALVAATRACWAFWKATKRDRRVCAPRFAVSSL